MLNTAFAHCPRCQSKLLIRPQTTQGYCPVCDARLKVSNPLTPVPEIDWNKQGELLDELDKQDRRAKQRYTDILRKTGSYAEALKVLQGLPKGTRKWIQGDPAWLRRSDYPSRAAYEVAYKKAVATYKKPNPLWTDLLIGAASGLGFGAGIKGVDHIFKSKDGEGKMKGKNPGTEPWMMTRAEYITSSLRFLGIDPNRTGRRTQAAREYLKREHEHMLRDALYAGKPVPVAVLKDYPYLARRNPWFPWKPKPKQENPTSLVKYRAFLVVGGRKYQVFPKSKKTSFFESIQDAFAMLEQKAKSIKGESRGEVIGTDGSLHGIGL